MSDKLNGPGVCVNTDRELWREPPGDFYASSVHVTESGGLGINVGGTVFVKSLRQWHEAAKNLAAAEERGRRSAIEVLELMRQHERVDSHVALLMGAIANIEALAPRDSGKDG